MGVKDRFWTWLAGVSTRRAMPGKKEEIGAPGLDIFSGHIQYRSLTDLTREERMDAFEKIRHHAAVAACRRAIISQLTNAIWTVDPFTEEEGSEPTDYDRQVADMVSEWLFEMPGRAGLISSGRRPRGVSWGSLILRRY